MNNTELDKLMKDEEFVASVLEAATIEEVKSLFSEKGLTLTDEDLDQMSKGLEDEDIVNNNGMVPDTNLTDVTGGITSQGAAGVGVAAGAAGVSALIYSIVKIYKKGYKEGQEECLNVIKNSGLLNNRSTKPVQESKL